MSLVDQVPNEEVDDLCGGGRVISANVVAKLAEIPEVTVVARRRGGSNRLGAERLSDRSKALNPRTVCWRVQSYCAEGGRRWGTKLRAHSKTRGAMTMGAEHAAPRMPT